MTTRKLLERLLLILILTSLVLGGSVPALAGDYAESQGPGGKKEIKDWYKQKIDKEKVKKEKRITPADRKAAAERAAAGGFTLEAMAAAAPAIPGQAPRYFSHPNYASSPLPVLSPATTVGNPLDVPRQYATDGVSNVFVVIPTAVLPDGFVQSFQTRPTPAYILRPTATAGEYQVIYDSGLLTVLPPSVPGTDEIATFPVPNIAVKDGDVIGFFGWGIPLDLVGTDVVSHPADTAPVQGSTIVLGVPPFPTIDPRTYSFAANVVTIIPESGIRKFLDGLPGLCDPSAGPCVGTDTLGQYIPLAVPDTTYPGYGDADYYEIAVVQFREQMHSDVPGEFGTGTLHRGYVQLTDCTAAGAVPLFNEMLNGPPVDTGYCGVTEPHFLGPAISATKDKPVRLLFRNLLPTGMEGNLFIPTDITVMGSGMGPSLGGMIEDTAGQVDPMCGTLTPEKPVGCFTENRATVHLHGGISPWISDGTPHQWITPDGERPYPDAAAGENIGVSVAYVPDMWYTPSGATINSCAGLTTCTETGATNDPGSGAQTYYFTNQQSARLMFYHDHAWGITRLNVYAGEAAAYLITDDTEQSLIDRELIPGPADTRYLVVQDRTFVPSPEQIALQDSTWDYDRWGGEGNLWLPHVYSPAQNPGDSSGVNEFGRWAYGPWFWPPTQNILYPPLTNTYYDPACVPGPDQWCEPEMMPGTPFNSMGMEAFHDTPIVNGTAYPTITVDPKAYRLRFLNAANDRFFNLSLYQAVDADGVVCDAANLNPAKESTGVACTEVALNPDELAAALDAPPDIFPTPVAGREGPDWIQIGTEGGFLPAPVEIPAQFTTWVVDPALFIAGLVDKHSLLLGPAERADTIVDFSQFAGQTLILYNDAPAAFPARDPRYDLYTGNADLRDTGGPPPTLPGYGPNMRTIMQIVVADAPVIPYDIALLEAAFAHQTDGSGVFESGQHPIIVGQAAYNSAYGTTFDQAAGDPDGFARITDFSMTFDTLSGVQMIDFPFQPKAIQDEMGEAFDREYGRMSGNLGLEVPLTGAGVAQNLILYPYSNPASELIDATNLPMALDPDNPGNPDYKVAPFSQANDGTQIWKITHNGVDTHPIHFHLYDVQLLNRVAWDGMIRPPDENELGWKDTVRISPLEDTIVALRPVRPVLPWDLPNSVRLLNPAMPEGSTVAFNSTDENANPTPPITNQMTNFGWEYVWHCHILSHEEMDMMRPQMVAEPPPPVTDLAGVWVKDKGTKGNQLTWTDPSIHETGFEIWRGLSANTADDSWGFVPLATVGADVLEYIDTSAKKETDVYFYQVFAINKVGFTGVEGYKNLTAKSEGSNIVQMGGDPPPPPPPDLPAAPTGLEAAVLPGPEVLLTWIHDSTNTTDFVIERAVGTGAFSFLARVAAPDVTYTDLSALNGNTYSYRVAAANTAGQSGYSNTAAVTVNLPPAAPTNLTFTVLPGPGVALTWTDNADNETSFVIHRADGTDGTGVFSFLASVGANITTFTDLNVVDGAGYTYRVAAVNAADQSLWSNELPVGLILPPAAPTGLTATGQAGPPPQVVLTWTDTATETGFMVQRCTGAGCTNFASLVDLGADVVTYTDLDVVSGNNYSYRVAAVNLGGQSGWSNEASAEVPASSAAPAAPTNVNARRQNRRVILTWTDNADNKTGFEIERASNAGFTADVVLIAVDPDTTRYRTVRLPRNSDHYFRVRAVNGADVSAWVNAAPFPDPIHIP